MYRDTVNHKVEICSNNNLETIDFHNDFLFKLWILEDMYCAPFFVMTRIETRFSNIFIYVYQYLFIFLKSSTEPIKMYIPRFNITLMNRWPGTLVSTTLYHKPQGVNAGNLACDRPRG